MFLFLLKLNIAYCAQQDLFIQASTSLVASQYLTICYSNSRKELMTCCNSLKEFRKKETKEKNCNPIDYVVENGIVYEIKEEKDTTGYDSELDTFLVILNTQETRRGLILYRTNEMDQKSGQEYIDEIKKIRSTGWPMIIESHNEQFAQKLLQEFPEANKSISIAHEKKTSFYGSILLIGVIVVSYVILYRIFIARN